MNSPIRELALTQAKVKKFEMLQKKAALERLEKEI